MSPNKVEQPPYMAKLILILSVSLGVLFGTSACAAEEDENILSDVNGDEAVTVVTFGDSITYGIGENGFEPDGGPRGWPTRAAALLGVPFDNQGRPGEELLEGGVDRFIGVIANSTADIVTILEGANDAIRRKGGTSYENAIQRLINVAVASGKKVAIFTPQTPCCEHGSQAPFTEDYANRVRTVAAANDIRLIDTALAWDTTCEGQSECDLYNIPDGLHPNSKGYDAMAQTAAAAFLGIDIFAEGGPQELEAALALEEGTVIVKPVATE